MAFDARKQIEERLVAIADLKKGAEARRQAAVSQHEAEIASYDEEIAEWNALLEAAAPAKPTAKKAAAPKK